jgi:hypothetical protein
VKVKRSARSLMIQEGRPGEIDAALKKLDESEATRQS